MYSSVSIIVGQKWGNYIKKRVLKSLNFKTLIVIGRSVNGHKVKCARFVVSYMVVCFLLSSKYPPLHPLRAGDEFK